MRRTYGVLALAALAGCGRFGQVEQGRVVAYDAAKGVVTVVRESKPGRYDIVPAVQVRVPERAGEMGPAPVPGKLLGIDTAHRRIAVYDTVAGGLRTIEYTEGASGITAVDPAARTSVTFQPTEEQRSLPPESWKAGDEVRYYFKQPGQALRMMNVTRTDLRKGH